MSYYTSQIKLTLKVFKSLSEALFEPISPSLNEIMLESCQNLEVWHPLMYFVMVKLMTGTFMVIQKNE